MKNKPLFSVIVPVYQVKDYLAECLEPLARQEGVYTYEVIMIDDGSSDGSAAICDKYAKKYPDVFTVIHQQNRGLAVARNRGLSSATGEWVSFVDGDDIPTTDFVLTLAHCVLSRHECDIGCAGYKYINRQGKVKKGAAKSGTSAGLFTAEQVLTNKVRAYVWSKCFKREFLDREGLRFYPFRSEFEDLPFTFAACLSAREVAFTRKPIYTYRAYRPGSISEDSGVKRLYSHISAFFACRGYTDRLLGPKTGVSMFKIMNTRLKLLLLPDLPYARKKEGDEVGAFARGLQAFRDLNLLKETKLQVYGAPWEREVLAYAGSLSNFVPYVRKVEETK